MRGFERTRMRLFLTALTVLMVVAACGGVGTKKKLTDLDDAIQRYGQALRWGRYADAEQYHLSREGERRRLDAQSMQSIRITGVTIEEKNVNEELSEATVSGQIKYYRTDHGTLQQVPFNQTWWYEPESKRWLLDSEFPTFK